MRTRVTLRDVAAKAGVHHTTASRALKNDPRVCAETLEKIRSIARQMGYSPDPMLSALNAYRHAARPASFHGTIGWITNHPTRDGWRTSTCYELYFQGAQEKLLQHGYHLEEFWLREPNQTAHRSSQVLLNRGIRGLLICPLPVSRGHLSLDWDQFSVVSFGYSLQRPKLHLFSAAHYRSVITCVRELRALSYRRIGMVTANDMNERMDRMWTAAYQVELPSLPRNPPIPIGFLRVHSNADDRYKSQFLKWYRTHKPDAIITPTSPVREWLKEEGYRVPEEVAVACASLQEAEDLSGVVEASRETGRAAADFLVGMLQRGEYGVPSISQRVLLEGKWFAGKTISSTLEKSAARASEQSN